MPYFMVQSHSDPQTQRTSTVIQVVLNGSMYGVSSDSNMRFDTVLALLENQSVNPVSDDTILNLIDNTRFAANQVRDLSNNRLDIHLESLDLIFDGSVIGGRVISEKFINLLNDNHTSLEYVVRRITRLITCLEQGIELSILEWILFDAECRPNGSIIAYYPLTRMRSEDVEVTIEDGGRYYLPPTTGVAEGTVYERHDDTYYELRLQLHESAQDFAVCEVDWNDIGTPEGGDYLRSIRLYTRKFRIESIHRPPLPWFSEHPEDIKD